MDEQRKEADDDTGDDDDDPDDGPAVAAITLVTCANTAVEVTVVDQQMPPFRAR